MSDPNLPEGVKQSDIDKTVGETFDPNQCEHDLVKCENCGLSVANFEFHVQEHDDIKLKIEKLQARLENIKTLCGYLHGVHPPLCSGWTLDGKKIIYEERYCDCYISDILHEIGMAEDFL